MQQLVWIILASLVTALVIGILHQAIPTYIDLPLAITLVVVEVPIGVLLHLFLKEKKQDSHVTQRVISESLADKHKEMDDYTNHLKLDIFTVLKSKNPSYFEGLVAEYDKKQMILQHLYTYETVEGTPLYRNYRKIWAVNNKIKKSRLDLSLIHSRLNSEIREICRDKKDFLIEHGSVNNSELLHVLGFKSNTNFYDESFDLNEIKPISENNIDKRHFYVERDYEDKYKYYIKYNQQIISVSDSKKIAGKLLELILKYGKDMIELVITLQVEKSSLNSIKKAFDEMMSHIDKSTEHGKPSFGVCDACIGFFPYGNKQVYNQQLIRCNYNPYNWWGEQYWQD